MSEPQTRRASLKIADQDGICPICRDELVDTYGDYDAPLYVIETEHHKALSDTYRLLGVCKDHAQIIMVRLWSFLPKVDLDE